MRKIIYATLIFSSVLVHAYDYFEARGFNVNSCYKHLAVRHCTEKNECNLEVFPYKTSALHFPLIDKSALINNKKTDDYGIFTFKIIDKKGIKFFEILTIEDILLTDFLKRDEKSDQSNKVKCIK